MSLITSCGLSGSPAKMMCVRCSSAHDLSVSPAGVNCNREKLPSFQAQANKMLQQMLYHFPPDFGNPDHPSAHQAVENLRNVVREVSRDNFYNLLAPCLTRAKNRTFLTEGEI